MDLLTILLIVSAVLTLFAAIMTARVGRYTRRMGEEDNGMHPAYVRHPALLNPVLWSFVATFILIVVITMYFTGLYH